MTDVAFDIDPEDLSESERFGSAPIFIFCDHASNAMPDAFNSLGLPEDLLTTHIAYDIGAAALSEAVARELDGEVFKSRFSRLIVDPNRHLNSDELIPAVSDMIPVPGNQMLSEEDRQRRIHCFHEAYHLQLGAAVSSFAERFDDALYISIHSFTHRLMGSGEERPWPVGMLWREDEPSARVVIDWLRAETGWHIGDNEPYDARVFNYSVDRHLSVRGLRHLTYEIRQDLLVEENGLAEFTDLLARSILALRETA